MNAIKSLTQLIADLEAVIDETIRKDDSESKARWAIASTVGRHAKDALEAARMREQFVDDPAYWVRWHASSVAAWRKIVEIGEALIANECTASDIRITLTNELLRNDFGQRCTCAYTRANGEAEREVVSSIVRGI